MSITYGFFNSVNGDRKYDAVQMSSIFDGVIVDGVFGSIGTAFAAKASGGLIVNVGIGKAWFNHTWTLNDSILSLTAPISEVLLDRIDAIVLDVNGSESVRQNGIIFVQGSPSSSPSRPTMIHEGQHHQYAICYIKRAAGSTEIRDADITNAVGTEETPLVTGILQTISLDELLGQWQDELDQFVENETSDFNTWTSGKRKEFEDWFDQLKTDLKGEQALLDQWVESEQTDFLAWFEQMKGQLSEDPAGNLQLEIDKEEIKRILIVGFVDGSKTFSDDGTVITSTASDGRKLVKTFSDGFLKATTVLYSSNSSEVAKLEKTFDASGKEINAVVTYTQ